MTCLVEYDDLYWIKINDPTRLEVNKSKDESIPQFELYTESFEGNPVRIGNTVMTFPDDIREWMSEYSLSYKLRVHRDVWSREQNWLVGFEDPKMCLLFKMAWGGK